MLNFKYSEIIKSDTATRLGIKNVISEEHYDNVLRAVVGLQRVRELIGVPMLVNSWYRCNELNTAVGGSPTSEHRLGLAIDFVPSGKKIEEVYNEIKNSSIPYNQLIIYPERGFIHISFGKEAKRQNLTK